MVNKKLLLLSHIRLNNQTSRWSSPRHPSKSCGSKISLDELFDQSSMRHVAISIYSFTLSVRMTTEALLGTPKLRRCRPQIFTIVGTLNTKCAPEIRQQISYCNSIFYFFTLVLNTKEHSYIWPSHRTTQLHRLEGSPRTQVYFGYTRHLPWTNVWAYNWLLLNT